jgi:cellulose synthase/poly-beta-1,6-N-acetylglucosamine synthase-like glycosyltransferase
MLDSYLYNNLIDISLIDDDKLKVISQNRRNRDVFYNRENLYRKENEKEILCCMTVYNEPGIAILISIASLIQNIEYMLLNSEKKNRGNTTLCIIIDGLESVSFSARELFIDLNIFSPDEENIFPDIDIREKHLDIIKVNKLLKEIDFKDEGNNRWLNNYYNSFAEQYVNEFAENFYYDKSFQKLHIFLCIKSKNMGKLNSHWWFFNIFCVSFKPKYCVQMDTGTVPQPNALLNCIKSFEENPRTGAIASMILISPVKKFYDILHIWQSGDFIYQKLLNWPTELVVGYLTVIPGQFCVFRWDAVYSKNHNPLKNTRNQIRKNTTPLENYFRGLNKLSPLEANMFLAEDRILGFEIVSRHKSNWKLEYNPSAVAITEPCESIKELLQQRRRWTNSCYTCNFWLIVNIGKLISNSSLPLKERLQTLFSVPWLSLNTLFMLIFPSFVTVLFYLFTFEVGLKYGIDSLLYKVLHFSLITLLVSLLVQLIMFSTKKFSTKIISLFYINTIILSFQYLALIIFIAFNHFKFANSYIFSGLTIFEPFSVLLISYIHSKRLFLQFSKITFQYFVFRPIFFLQITLYSLCNLHDCTWGTKGLFFNKSYTKDTQTKASDLRSLYNFRAIIVALWIMLNITIIILVMYYENVVLDLFNIFLILITFSAGLKFICGIKLFANKKYFV